MVAKKAGLSETNVARLKHINQHLEPELKEAMEAGKIGISVADELARMKPEEQQMVAKKIDAGEKITLQKEKTVKATEKQDAAESRSVSESDTTQCKQSESRKIMRTEQHEEEQLPGQISLDDYVSEQSELSDTNNEEIDVAVSVDDVAKKESSTTTENDLMQSLAHDYLALYERGDGSETEWQAMHRQAGRIFCELD